jgi:hypothetical protein
VAGETWVGREEVAGETGVGREEVAGETGGGGEGVEGRGEAGPEVRGGQLHNGSRGEYTHSPPTHGLDMPRAHSDRSSDLMVYLTECENHTATKSRVRFCKKHCGDGAVASALGTTGPDQPHQRREVPGSIPGLRTTFLCV